MTRSTLSDAELVAAYRDGDGAAFATIYDRYCDRLHSYCNVMLRNRDDAADATQDAFVKAAQSLDQLRDPAKLRPWLYAIARNEATNQMRRRSRVEARDDAGDTLVDERDPADDVSAREVADLVWAAIDGLTPRDRELADLHLREGLDGPELAGVVGVSDSHLRVLLSRMRDRVERSLGALLVARVGRDDCSRLGSILRGWDGRFSMEVRTQVTRHVESCDTCTQRRSLVLTPVELLPSILFLPAPEALRAATLHAAGRAPAPGAEWSGEQMVSDRGASRAAGVPVAAVAALVAVLVAGSAVLAGASRPTGELALSAPATTFPAATGTPAGPAVAGTTAPDPAADGDEDPGGELATESTVPGTGDDGGVTTTAPDVSPPTTTPTTRPPTDTTDAPATTTEPPATTTQPPTTTTTQAPTTTTQEPATTTSPPPPPPTLTLDRSTIGLGGGLGRSSAQVTLSNGGGSPAVWQATSGASGFSVSPAQGTLQPGASMAVTILVDRSGLAEGDAVTAVTFSAGPARATLQATASTDRPPGLGGAAVDPADLWAPGGSCRPTQGTATVTVTDESAISKVVAEWGAEDGQPRSTDMSPGSARGRYTVVVGPFRNTRTAHTVRMVATDARGNSASTTVSVKVTACS